MALHPEQVILLVDDSPEDREVTIRAIKKANLPNPVVCCEDGDQALDYLYQRGVHAGLGKAPRPGVILLDLNMPGTDGREVLEVVKGDTKLKSIPVVILTTSTDDRDIDAFFRSGANSYLVKPATVDTIVPAVHQSQKSRSITF